MRSYRGNLNWLWLIIGINIVLFIVTVADQSLVFSLGLQPEHLWQRPWTMVTNLFIHAGIIHLIVNMIALFFLGSYTIQLVGAGNFLKVYFAGGILGNVFYLLLGPPLSVAVGASGAIFALGGALAVMMPMLRVFVFPIPAPVPLWVAIIGGFIIISIFPGVAWQAHLGGLLLGLAAGFYFRRTRPFLV